MGSYVSLDQILFQQGCQEKDSKFVFISSEDQIPNDFIKLFFAV